MPSQMQESSRSLIRRVQGAEPDAWRRLVHLYGPEVYAWARGAGLQTSDAADVVQEVFRSVATAIADFRRQESGDTFRGWLWTIARNKVRDHFRELKSRPTAVGGTDQQRRMEQIPEPADEPEDKPGAQTRISQRALRLIEAEFPPHQWQAFQRVTLGGQSPPEVAAELGISVWSVYQAKSRILRRLRQELDELIEP